MLFHLGHCPCSVSRKQIQCGSRVAIQAGLQRNIYFSVLAHHSNLKDDAIFSSNGALLSKVSTKSVAAMV